MRIDIRPNPGNDDFISKLQKLGDEAEGMAKRAVFSGAGVIADAVKAATPVDLGDLSGSLGITKISVFADVAETRVGYDGYDRKGVPNQLKARAYESGTSRGQPKRPFFRPAANGARQAAIGAMASEVDDFISKNP